MTRPISRSSKWEQVISAELPVYYFQSTSSTQEQAREIVSQTSYSEFLVVADYQSAGKGRQQRSWVSLPAKGLYLTYCFSSENNLVKKLSGLSILVGLSIVESLRGQLTACSAQKLQLKWPNDLLWRSTTEPTFLKLGGVLIEIIGVNSASPRVLIGVGINLAQDIQEILPSAVGFRELAARNYTAQETLNIFFDKLLGDIDIFFSSGLQLFLERWAQVSIKYPDRVKIIGANGTFHLGRIEGLNLDGSLSFTSEEGTKLNIISGDVSFSDLASEEHTLQNKVSAVCSAASNVQGRIVLDGVLKND